MREIVALLSVAACAAPGLVACAASDPTAVIRAADVQRHVDFLASDELEGRWSRGPGALRAAEYVAEHFGRAGLAPFGDDGTWFQAVAPDLSPNVVGILRGTADEAVLVTAHYDHLEPLSGGADRIYNGADDNASGTAAVLELAEAFGALQRAPEASLVCVAFTAEELGLQGSKHFAANPPLPLERIRGVFNLDMVSRGDERLIFCEGGPSSPRLVRAVQAASAWVDLEVRYDEHPEWLGASDHAPFLRAGVEALYFGVEDHPDYHRVSDHADRILPALTERVAKLVLLAALDVARDDL
ncbi:MAG: M20/M25/M40 family metallo-hydrolase [Planctomycetota bacterium]